jgi:hypothetical protein
MKLRAVTAFIIGLCLSVSSILSPTTEATSAKEMKSSVTYEQHDKTGDFQIDTIFFTDYQPLSQEKGDIVFESLTDEAKANSKKNVEVEPHASNTEKYVSSPKVSNRRQSSSHRKVEMTADISLKISLNLQAVDYNGESSGLSQGGK